MGAYISIAEAQTYFDERLNTDPWDTAVTTDRTKALAMATKIIDRLNYRGEKTDEEQELQFPRDTDTTVPQNIQNACAEIALALLDGVDSELEFENLSMTSQGYGNVRSTYNRSTTPGHLIAGIPSVTAWRMLQSYLRSNRSVTMSRVN